MEERREHARKKQENGTEEGTKKGWRVGADRRGEREREKRERERGRDPLNPLGEAGLRKKKICHGQASRFLDFRVFSNPRSENSRAGRFGVERVERRRIGWGRGKGRDVEGGGNRISLL